jgi:hypothetical protein
MAPPRNQANNSTQKALQERPYYVNRFPQRHKLIARESENIFLAGFLVLYSYSIRLSDMTI